TGAPIGEPLRGHDDWVRAVAFSPDGKTLVSGSRDKTIRMWDAQTGAPIGEPSRGDPSSVDLVASNCPIGTEVVPLQDDRLSPSSPYSEIATPESSMPSLKILFQPSPQSIPLTSQGQWIMYLNRRILWLPHQYLVDASNILMSNGTLAISNKEYLFIIDLSSLRELLP
ncbi:hypothetical protein FRB90_005615, partial [Tulasnella sp. 427]